MEAVILIISIIVIIFIGGLIVNAFVKIRHVHKIKPLFH